MPTVKPPPSPLPHTVFPALQPLPYAPQCNPYRIDPTAISDTTQVQAAGCSRAHLTRNWVNGCRLTGRLTQSMGVYSKYRLVLGLVPLKIALYWVCCALLPTVALLGRPEPQGSHLKLLKKRFCSDRHHREEELQKHNQERWFRS